MAIHILRVFSMISLAAVEVKAVALWSLIIWYSCQLSEVEVFPDKTLFL